MNDRQYIVVTDAKGEHVATVLGLDGVRLKKGWSTTPVDRPAGPGERWCPKRKGFHSHDGEQQVHERERELARHSRKTRGELGMEIAALDARIATLEAIIKSKGA